ncbi:MAG: FecR domain-containing protein, partial [Myxococcota bacterium]
MMRLGHKIPVEPLDEQRYQRVEDAIVAAMPGSSPASAAAPGRTPGQRWFARLGGARWLVPAVVAAGVALALYAGLGGLDAGDPGQPLPTRIATGDGSSTFGLGDAVCTAAPHSDLTLDLSGDSAGRANIAWQLERGEITCEVEPRPERAAVVVRAGAVTVTVVGTVFTVGRGSGDSREVYVAVSRGQVRVDTAGRSFEVGTGQRWTESTMEVTSSDAEWAAAVGDRAAATRGPEAGAEAGADSDVDTDA